MCQDQAGQKQAVLKIYTFEMYLIKICFPRDNNTRHMLLKHIQRIRDTQKNILFSKFKFYGT